jgi:hypothetical protein
LFLLYSMAGLQPGWLLTPAGADGGDRDGHLPRCCITQASDMGYRTSCEIFFNTRTSLTVDTFP